MQITAKLVQNSDLNLSYQRINNEDAQIPLMGIIDLSTII